MAAPVMPKGVAATAAMSMVAPSWSMPLIGPAEAPLVLPSGSVLAMRCPRMT